MWATTTDGFRQWTCWVTKVSWVFENKQANLPFIGSPAIYGDHVIIGNQDKFVYCLNKKNGKVVWKYNTGGTVDASPVVVGKRVLAANMRGDLFLMDRKAESLNGPMNWVLRFIPIRPWYDRDICGRRRWPALLFWK